MKTQLRTLADIRAGIPFREAIRHAEHGTIGIVQAGDISAGGTIDLDRVTRVSSVPDMRTAEALRAGEVLLQCRGQTYRAAVVPEADLEMVASASLLILDPQSEIRPAYLAFYLNDPSTQTELRRLATGATIANLKRSAVELLEVHVPTLKDQDRIVALDDTMRQLSLMEARLAELRRIELRALMKERAERNRRP